MPSTAQPAPETDEKKSRGLGSYVLWAFVALNVYVLSYGPVLFAFGMNRTTGFIYAPWYFVYEETFLHTPLGKYLHLWRPDMYDSNGDCGLRIGY